MVGGKDCRYGGCVRREGGGRMRPALWRRTPPLLTQFHPFYVQILARQTWRNAPRLAISCCPHVPISSLSSPHHAQRAEAQRVFEANRIGADATHDAHSATRA